MPILSGEAPMADGDSLILGTDNNAKEQTNLNVGLGDESGSYGLHVQALDGNAVGGGARWASGLKGSVLRDRVLEALARATTAFSDAAPPALVRTALASAAVACAARAFKAARSKASRSARAQPSPGSRLSKPDPASSASARIRSACAVRVAPRTCFLRSAADRNSRSAPCREARTKA